jgi:hypothetical protein
MEEWRGQVGGDHQPDQRDREGARGGALRDAGGLQIHWLTDYAGQLRLAERKARGYRFAITCRRKDGVLAGLLCCEMVANGGSRWASN